MRARVLAVLTVLSVVLSGLVIGAVGPVPSAGASGGGVVDLTGSVPATFTVTPGVEQVTVTGGPVRAPLTLADGDTLERIVTLYTDDLGQLTFQYVPNTFLVFDQHTGGVLPTTDGSTVRPGNYRIISEGVPGQPFAGPVEASDPFAVLSADDHPDTSLYNQTLPFVSSKVTGGVQDGHTDAEGYGYLTVRDGVKLSVNVRLPDPTLYGPGPYPTVIQYSGYAPSQPGTPAGADAGGMLAGVLGFAYVGINVRGSGCSGGVFDVFNAAQAADGYDAVETVARQPWVKNGKPGMIGISYSGITQMYVAATQPPHLAAITPMSIIEDPWDQQWAGGIYNSGFTKQWLKSRDDEAAGGAQWVKDRVAGGDTTCTDNLKIRSQNVPFEAFAKSLDRRPADADARNLSILARKITVPVHLSGAWQDEQTGARFGVLLDDFVNVPPGQKKLTMYNGHHPDGLSPLIMTRWFEFLSFYVDTTIPKVNTLVRGFSDPQFTAIFGVPGNTFEPNRFLQFGTDTPIYGDYAGSLNAYQAEQPVRVLFEVGASPDFVDTYPGAHKQRFVMNFPSWPPPDASPRTFYFGPNSSLTDTPPAASEIDRFSYEPEVLGTNYNVSGDFLHPQVNNDWKVTNDGKGLEYISAPLTDQMVVAGEGYVNLWVRSSAIDTPLEAVLSEVYADPDPSDAVPPEEVRVQDGLLRTAFRTLDPARSTAMLKEHLFYAANYTPMPAGQFVNIQVPILSVAHPFRAGSRVRIEINTAGGDLPYWFFEFDDHNPATNDVAVGGAMPSSLVLPVLPSNNIYRRIPTAFADQTMHPPCNSLRGQPCRTYKSLANEVVPDTAPDAPTAAQAVAGKSSATVSWTAPAFDGGAAVTGYTVTAAPGGATCSWTTGPLSCTVPGLTAGQTYDFTVTATNSVGTGPASAPSNQVVPWDGSGYHPLTPTRILDSRGSTGGWGGPLVAGSPQDLQVTGLGGASDVPATASAVVMNVTVTGGSANSFVTAYPAGEAAPNTSNVNFAANQTIANLVTVKIGTGGAVSLANAVGSTDVVADVVGYYDDGTGPGDLYTGITPTRLLDSRDPAGAWSGTPLTAGTPRDLAVRQPGNPAGVPATATAVIANVTVTGGTDGSFVSVWPSGVAQPNVSNQNFAPGQTIPNLAVVQIGANGAISIANAVGAVDVVVDVVGYFDPTAGSRFHAISPTRVLDDRDGTGLSGPWGAAQTRVLPVAGAAATNVPAGATGLAANVTATAASTGSFLTVFPDGVAVPTSSNVNFGPNETIPNLVTVKIAANGNIAIYNELGTVDVIADAVGYYALT